MGIWTVATTRKHKQECLSALCHALFKVGEVIGGGGGLSELWSTKIYWGRGSELWSTKICWWGLGVGLNFGQLKYTGGLPYFYLLIFINKTD